MIIYKPIKKAFRNRLEAKLALGQGNFNRLFKKAPDDFLLTNNEDLFANYEYFYTNPIETNRTKYQK